MKQKAIYQAIYNGEAYEFEHGAQLYIFDCALYWDIDQRGRRTLETFIYFVYRCYMKDDNATPLGPLTDYIAENWDRIQEKEIGAYDVLEEFYLHLA